MRLSLVALVGLVGVGGAWARSTDCTQLTTEGRSIAGSFSPDGRQVAYLSLVKRFGVLSQAYFDGRVHVWDGRSSRTVAVITGASFPLAGGSEDVREQWAPRWLPGGRYLVQRYNLRSAARTRIALIRLSDGAVTKGGESGRWFVLNDDWPLTDAEAGFLNRLLCGGVPPGWAVTGQRLGTDRLPARVPRSGQRWRYDDFVLSPAGNRYALYIGYDKHFDGCCCTEGTRKVYLGVADLRSGRLRRLTHTEDGHLSPERVSWSPDGSRIAYLWQEFCAEREPRWTSLRTVRRDGSDARELVRDASDFVWLDSHRLLATLGLSTKWARPARVQQLAIIDVNTGDIRRITKGEFRHVFCDVRGDRYLVDEQPGDSTGYQGNLYIIRPL